ncbi:Phosphatidylinositol 4-kinase beta [Perkinsus chesapeaki]|uniref:1-phosphatidylinositol 4-kinase n=1 Tax=Perkinsus chesapeaki TaxID=330153 RepID=A0A7J6LRK3_PERCH|nr:Phosphatidylinositol 4-kinase beta [Perkinsus chesapeaki]
MVSESSRRNDPSASLSRVAVEGRGHHNIMRNMNCFAPLKAWLEGCIPKIHRRLEDAKEAKALSIPEEEENTNSDIWDGFGEGIDESDHNMTNIYSHMHHLENADLGQVDDFLVSQLYKIKVECVDFYLPQLVYASMKEKSAPDLQSFLLMEASTFMGLAIKMHWLYHAIVEDGVELTGKDMHRGATKMEDACETAVLTCDRPLKDSPGDFRGRESKNFAARGRSRTHSMVSLRSTAGFKGEAHRGRSEGSLTVPDRASSISENPVCKSCPNVQENHPSPKSNPPGNLRQIESLERLRVLSRGARNRLVNTLGHVSAVYSDLGDPLICGESLMAQADYADEKNGLRRSDAADWGVLDEDSHYSMEKLLRCDYFKTQNSFVRYLTGLACSLAKMDDRTFELSCSIALLNEWLFEKRAGVAVTTGLYRLMGVSLPLGMPGCAFRKDNVRGHIVKIHDCKVFKTHTRAPFMMVVEIADLEEMVEKGRRGDLRSSRGRCDAASSYIIREMGIEPETLEKEDRPTGALRDELRKALNDVTPDRWCDMFYDGVFREKDELEEAKASTGNVKRSSIGKSLRSFGQKCAKKPSPAKIRKSIWGEPFSVKKERLRRQSVYGNLRSWNCIEIMVKGGDDVRQEVLAGQLVRILQNIFKEAQLPLWLKPYETVAVDSESGLMEMLTDTVSIDCLKREFPDKNLMGIFKMAFGDSKESLARARKNFIQSLAAYSLFSYFLAVRDRHNGNLLLDRQGHLIHIDFGFMLSSAPGNIPFENAPFKLTQEYIEVIGGEDSDEFEYFRTLVIRGFLEARKHKDRLLLPVKMLADSGCTMECLIKGGGPEQTVKDMDGRFYGSLPEEACIQKIVELIDTSVDNWRTIQYDEFQRITNGIM